MDGMSGKNGYPMPTRFRARRLLRQCALSLIGATSAAVLVTTGFTYAALSDSDSRDVATTAATVVFGADDDDSFGLDYTGMQPGDTQRGTLTVRYEGTVPADISLELRPDGRPAFCTATGAPLAGESLVVTVEGAVSDQGYCGLLDRTLSLGTVDPGETVTRQISVTLSERAPEVYSDLSGSDVLTVHASHGFTDRVEGAISIGIADFAPEPPPIPPTPDECSPMAFAEDQIVVLEPGQHEWDATEDVGPGAGPFLVFGTEGADTIVGSNKSDCIVGGAGADTLTGAQGKDVLLGGAGDDELSGNQGKDDLYGGAGHDDLRGGNGKDFLDGGQGLAACDGGKAKNELRNCDPTESPVTSSSETSSQSEPQPKVAEPAQSTESTAPVQETSSATASISPVEEPASGQSSPTQNRSEVQPTSSAPAEG